MESNNRRNRKRKLEGKTYTNTHTLPHLHREAKFGGSEGSSSEEAKAKETKNKVK